MIVVGQGSVVLMLMIISIFYLGSRQKYVRHHGLASSGLPRSHRYRQQGEGAHELVGSIPTSYTLPCYFLEECIYV